MSGGRKVRTYLFPAILSTTASARESSGVGCSSLAESLLCVLQPVTNEAVKVNFGLQLLPLYLCPG